MTAGQRGDGAGADLDALIRLRHPSWCHSFERCECQAGPINEQTDRLRAALAAANERAEAAEANVATLLAELDVASQTLENVRAALSSVRREL